MTIESIINTHGEQQLTEWMEYLDELRLSGETNMFGAGIYLQREFPLTGDEATTVLMHWMDTFSERNP